MQQYRLVDVESNRAQSPGFWNFLIPEQLCSDHNDIYNDSILAAASSLFQVANPERTKYPGELGAILEELRRVTKVSGNNVVGDRLGQDRREMTNGMALRLPHNASTISTILGELERDLGADNPHQRWHRRWHIELFAILKFANRDKDGWTRENLERLRLVLHRPGMLNKLAIAGTDDGDPATNDRDPNLDAFCEFVQTRLEIRVPIQRN